LCWGMGMYNLPSPEDESQVCSTYGSSVCSFFTLSLKGTDALRVLRRELIPHGETGGLIIFEDHPNYWDAWGASLVTWGSPVLYYSLTASDVEIHHLEKCQPLKFENIQVVASGPARGVVEAEAKYGSSTIRVTVSAI
jgi:hypothetical protein